MKKAISMLMLLVVLMTSVTAFAGDAGYEQDIKKVIEKYFALKYKMLSSLTYNSEIEELISPAVLASESSISEPDILRAVVEYRKRQINDLKFDRYKYNVEYIDITILKDKAWVSFNEGYELYFNCAPTVKNSSVVRHIMCLQNNKGQWTVVSDEYSDADEVKKRLSRYFIDKDISFEKAMEMFLSDTEGYVGKRAEGLEALAAELKDEKAAVFFAGKGIAYVNGRADVIDSSKGIAPVDIDGIIYIPLRYYAESLGYEVVWEDASKSVRISGDKGTVSVGIGQKSIGINGKSMDMEAPALLLRGRTLLPAGAVAAAFNMELYKNASGLAVFTSTAVDANKDAAFIDKVMLYYSSLFSKTDFPRVDGSTATYPLSMEMGKELLGLDDTGVRGFITHNTTHNAYVNLINGSADIILVTQPSEEEYKLAEQKNVELEVVPICREGFVFLVNKDNSTEGITSQQVRDIYQGRISNWKQLGGGDREIIAYQREKNSGSQTLMENTVMKGLTMMLPPTETLVIGMGELIDRVADYSNARNAIGYSVYYYATTMYNSRNVKLLSIDGVAPDSSTIKSGEYPFTVGYYAVLRKDEPEDSNARKLLKWLLMEEGQGVVEKAGFVPVN